MSYSLSRIGTTTFHIIAVVATIGLAFWLGQIAQESESVQFVVQRFGYAGAFFISVFSGFNFVAPFPAVSFLPLFIASGLQPAIVLALMTAGMTIADAVAYLIGRMGRHIAASAMENRIRERLDRIRLHRHWAPVLVLLLFAAFVPLPNELIVMPLGFLGYRLRTLLPVVFLGNAVFNTIAALGIINLFELL